jgi:hypothetical protein
MRPQSILRKPKYDGSDGSLFEGRPGSGFFLEELDLNKASFALETFATVFQAEVYAILLVPTTV